VLPPEEMPRALLAYVRRFVAGTLAVDESTAVSSIARLHALDESDVYREKMESIMQVILQYRGLAALPRRDIIAKRFFWGYSVAAIRESTGAPSALIESILRWYLQPENAKALQEARGR
jgi:hypothetical protein